MDFEHGIINHLSGSRFVLLLGRLVWHAIQAAIKTEKERADIFEELRSMNNVAIECLFLSPQEIDTSRYEALLGYFEKMIKTTKRWVLRIDAITRSMPYGGKALQISFISGSL